MKYALCCSERRFLFEKREVVDKLLFFDFSVIILTSLFINVSEEKKVIEKD